MFDQNLVSYLSQGMHAALLSFPRFIGVFALLPLFNTKFLPGLIRHIFTIVVAFPVIPLTYATLDQADLSHSHTIFLLMKEMFIGVVLGYLGAIVFWAVEGAGFIIDNQRGATMASSMDPLTGNQTSPFGMLLLQAFLTYFVALGGITIILGVIYTSFILWPVLSFWPILSEIRSWDFIGYMDYLMRAAFIIAAPVMIAMFLTELAVGLVGRFTPQLNIFFIAMPLKSATAMILLIVYVGLIFMNSHQEITLLKDLTQRAGEIIS